jgi:hypothetical protein
VYTIECAQQFSHASAEAAHGGSSSSSFDRQQSSSSNSSDTLQKSTDAQNLTDVYTYR